MKICSFDKRVFASLIELLNQSKIVYAIVGDYQNLPDSVGHDIDIWTNNIKQFRKCLFRAVRENKFNIFMDNRTANGCNVVFYRRDDDTITMMKVDVMKDRILSINKDAIVETYPCFFLPSNQDEFNFKNYTYIVDAIDTVTAKIALIQKANEDNVPIISSMGAGNKLNPQGFKVTDISKTKVDPLAKVMRRELKKRGINKLKVVYSEEEPIKIEDVPEEIKLEMENIDHNFLLFKDADPIFDYYTPVLIANNDYLEKNSDASRAFIAAVKKGYEYAAENPDEAADILLKAAPELDKNLVKKSQAYLSTQYIADAKSWGVIDPKRWNAFYDWLNENKLVENELPENAGLSTDYLS